MKLKGGDRLGAYEILSQIGAGGMGVVYRARDVRLGRIVAIKLPAGAGSVDEERRRLLREAQHASALNHPNICTIYEIDESDGRLFIVEEYVDGETLDALIHKGALPVDRASSLATQIADALAHAHAHGVVHRDLKPANVMITADGQAKVLDFGLAQRTWHEGATHAATIPVTRAGSVAGTIAYMAPETLRGARPDSRCDIWALGAILFEMVAGVPPFRGATEFDLSSRILNDGAPPLSSRVPSWYADVVSGCLAKDPVQRYQHAAEVRDALRPIAQPASRAVIRRHVGISSRSRILLATVAAGFVLLVVNRFLSTPVLATTSVAVIPFASEASTPDDEYLSEGITEGVIDNLSRVPKTALKVIALNSVRPYKARDVDATVVGKALHVGAVVFGRVAQDARGLRLTAELVDASDRSRLWGKSFTARLSDLPAVQTEIAENVSAALRLQVDPAQTQRLAKRGTDNVDAYRLYLKGRYFANKYNEDGWNRSIEYFRQALDIDPTYAAAWAGLADTYYEMSGIVLQPSLAMPTARAAATKALAIDDGIAEAHAALAVITEQYDWDSKAAAPEFRRALDLNPNDAAAHHWYGQHLFVNAHFDAALAEFTKARELDPLSLIAAVSSVYPLPHLGREDAAVQEVERVAEAFPDSTEVADWAHELRGEVYLNKGMHAEAVDEFVRGSKVIMLCGRDPATQAMLKQAYVASGLSGYWRKELEIAVPHFQREVEAARKQSLRRYVSPRWLAELYARVGDKERAFTLLQDVFDNRDENLRFLKVEALRVNSPWEILRADPRFTALIRGMGLEE